MFISHKLKKALFRVPKTGSSTMAFVLRFANRTHPTDIATEMMLGGFKGSNTIDYRDMIRKGAGRTAVGKLIETRGGMPQHLTPQGAIDNGYITQEQVEEYQVFVCCRDPYQRRVSAFLHSHKRMPLIEDFRSDLETSREYGLLVRPTVDYAYCGGKMIADLLDFDDYVNETKRMLAAFGGDIFPLIPKMNVSNPNVFVNAVETKEDYWTEELKELIQERDADDFALWNLMKASK